MATGLAAATCTAILDAIGNAVPFSFSAVWIKLHVGDPGAAGTANAAVETDRQQASFGAASGVTLTNDAVLTWLAVAAIEDFTHFSAWTASTAGTFEFSGLITANAVQVDDDFEVGVGGLDLALTAAS